MKSFFLDSFANIWYNFYTTKGKNWKNNDRIETGVIRFGDKYCQRIHKMEALPVSNHGGGVSPCLGVRAGKSMAIETAEQYADLIKRHHQALDDYAKRLEGLAALEQEINPSRYGGVVRPVSKYKLESIRRDMASRIGDILIEKASRHFAGPDGCLEIQKSDFEELHPIGEDGSGFDPVQFWASIEVRYGKGQGERIALEQAAQGIKRQFFTRSYENDGPPKIVKGAVILKRRIYTETSFSGKVEISYNTANDLYGLHRHLAVFAAWADRPTLARALQQPMFSGPNKAIVSRGRYPFGGHDELVIVTFRENFEYRFRLDVADQLRLFLSEHAPAVEAQAA